MEEKKNLCNSCLKADICRDRVIDNGEMKMTKCKDYVSCILMPKSAPAKYEANKTSERDEALLAAIDDMIQTAPKLGICPLVFQKLKEEVLFIMGERDGLKASAKAAKI